MNPSELHWWFSTDAGLAARIGIGIAIFTVLAYADLLQHGKEARRWREYLFLLATVATAMGYGAANDSLASGISPEYFIFGKGVANAGELGWAACTIGLKASFSAGLIVGVALLIANNPRPNRPPLPYRRMAALLAIVAACAVMAAAVGAGIGWCGGWNWTSPDLAAIWHEGLFRPRHFMAVYGMNLGGYAGAAIGTAAAVITILRRRRPV